MNAMKFGIPFCALSLTVLLSACGDDGGGSGDAGTTAGTTTGTPATSSPTDSGPPGDTGTPTPPAETGDDTAADTAVDTGADTGADTSGDTGADTGAASTGADTGGESSGGGAALCGWNRRRAFYDCGGEGEGPKRFPIVCPEGVKEGAACEATVPALSGEGCCDGDAVYYCTQEGTVFSQACE